MFIECTQIVNGHLVPVTLNSRFVTDLCAAEVVVHGNRVTGTLLAISGRKKILEFVESYEWFKDKLNVDWTETCL